MVFEPYINIVSTISANFNKSSISALLSQLSVKVAVVVFRLVLNRSPLHLAVNCMDHDMVRYLVDKGCDVDALDRDGNTPLMCAFLFYPCPRMIEFLTISGARLDVCNVLGKSPLTCVNRCTYKRQYAAMIASAKKAPGYSAEALSRMLLEADWTLAEIAKFREVEVTRCAFERELGVNRSKKLKNILLHKAVSIGDSSIVQLLLERGAKPKASIRGYSALHVAACRWGMGLCMSLLLKHGAQTEQTSNDGSTALHIAAYFHRVENVRMLLEHGANVSAENNSRSTPLLQALRNCRFTIENEMHTVFMLLEYGADEDRILKAALEIKHGYQYYVWKMLVRQFAKLEFLGRMVPSERHKKIIDRCNGEKYYGECLKELEKMRNTEILQSVKVIHLLLDDIGSSVRHRKYFPVRYSRIDKLVDIFESGFVKTEFPIYFKSLKIRFNSAVKIKDLQEHAIDVLSASLPIFEPPCNVVEKILSYLEIGDLQKLK